MLSAYSYRNEVVKNISLFEFFIIVRIVASCRAL